MRIWLTILFGIIMTHSIGQKVFSNVQDGVAYINHAVKKGEGAYGISKIYNAAYDEFLKLNGLQKDAILHEGIVLKIPLNGILKQACNGDSCVPVYYTVQQSEGLYRIGKNHGDIKAPAIKQLNHLNSESVSKGQELLVGYIDVSKRDIQLNSQQATPVIAATTEIVNPVFSETHPVEIKAEKSAEPGPSKQAAAKKLIGDSSALTYKGRGFFETAYKDGSNIKMIKGATFKSESGWADGKFYALMDGMETGTIVKITNPENGRVIFGKILGPLPHVKNAENVQIRISSAGMMTLGYVYEEMYDMEINY
jgi:LysM repeat protein